MKFLVLLILIGFAGIIYTQQAFAEDSFDSMYDFSEKDFETGRFSYPYGEKFYQYKYEPFGALAEESFSRCHFTSSFVLSNDSPSESGNVIYKFPRDMVWPGGYENSTFYIARSSSFNFPEDSHFEKLTPTKTNDGMVLEFEILTGLNTFVANSTAFWDSQRSQKINCSNPFDFEKQEYEYYDFVYLLKIQQDYAKVWGLAEDDFLCKPQLVPVLKIDGSPACVMPESIPKLIERGWAVKDSGNTDTESTILSGLQVDVTGQQQIRRGTTHDIVVDVTRDGHVVSDVFVRITIEDYGKNVIRDFNGRTDDSGRSVFSWEIPKSFDDIKTLLAYVDVTDDVSAKTILFKFQVYCLPGEPGCKVEGN